MGFWKKWLPVSHKADAVRFFVPEGKLVYAIGDIHGRVDLLQALLSKIDDDLMSRSGYDSIEIIFLGDYVDRGFHSKEVIDLLMNLRSDTITYTFLAGNHEDLMLQFIDDPLNGRLWLDVGGFATLASYGVYLPDDAEVDGIVEASSELEEKLPASHVEFLRSLDEHYIVGDYVFVHAGLRPGVPFEEQQRFDKLGIRGEFTSSNFDFGRKIVHGHTGVSNPKNFSNRIPVDTGAFATGMLTSAVLQNDDVSFLTT